MRFGVLDGLFFHTGDEDIVSSLGHTALEMFMRGIDSHGTARYGMTKNSLYGVGIGV